MFLFLKKMAFFSGCNQWIPSVTFWIKDLVVSLILNKSTWVNQRSCVKQSYITRGNNLLNIQKAAYGRRVSLKEASIHYWDWPYTTQSMSYMTNPSTMPGDLVTMEQRYCHHTRSSLLLTNDYPSLKITWIRGNVSEPHRIPSPHAW